MIILCRDNLAVVQPKGQLDLQNGVALSQALSNICADRYSCWVIDLNHVDTINNAGLTALVNSFNLARQRQCRLVLLNPAPPVKLVFEITQFDQLLDVVEVADVKPQHLFDFNQIAIAQAA